MNTISKWLAALALLSGPVAANAALIHGTYSGIVVAGGSGMIGTLDASTVASGTPIYGTFSYDSQIFALNGSGSFVATESVNPVVITITIAGSTFAVHGTIQSVLNLVALPSSNIPNNHFYLEAANWGASVPGLSGSIDLNLGNYLGTPFASNIEDPASVVFAHQSAYVTNDIDTLQAIDSTGTSTAALYFTIVDASTAPSVLLAALLKEVTGVGPEGLADKVEAAQHQTQASCSHLTAFVNQVQSHSKGIGAQLGSKLIADAQAIEAALGCD